MIGPQKLNVIFLFIFFFLSLPFCLFKIYLFESATHWFYFKLVPLPSHARYLFYKQQRLHTDTEGKVSDLNIIALVHLLFTIFFTAFNRTLFDII